VGLSLASGEWQPAVHPWAVTPVAHSAGWRAAEVLQIAQVQELILVRVVVGAAGLGWGLGLTNYHQWEPWWH
jgi:hypothetical protein